MVRTHDSSSHSASHGGHSASHAHHDTVQSRAWILFLIVSIPTLVGVGLLVRHELGGTPYMDEIFHLRQTQSYCVYGNWSHWDPKITTLPGLYVLSTGFARGSALVLQPLVNLLEYFVFEPFGPTFPGTSGTVALVSASIADGTKVDISSRPINTRIASFDKKDDFVYEALYSSEMTVVVTEIIRESIGEVLHGNSPVLHYLCSFDVLRFIINPLFSIVSIFIIHQIWQLHRDTTETQTNYFLRLTVIYTFPLSFFFYFLYYTDTGSLMFVLMTLWALEAGCPRLSVLPAIAAVLFRQTNIVWIAFILFNHLTKRVFIHGGRLQHDKLSSQSHEKAGKHDSPGDGSIVDNVVQITTIAVPEITRYVFSNLFAFIWEFGLYAFVMGGFIAFIAWNGGITVGDRSAHQAVIHTPQFFYLLLFIGIFGRLMLALDPSGRHFAPFAPLEFFTVHLKLCVMSPLKQGAATVAILAGMLYAVETQTMAHPYLLADNRHYTFYIWQRTFQRHPWFKYSMVPVYYAIAWVVRQQIQHAMRNIYQKFAVQRTHTFTLLWTIGLALCTAATIVPSPLLEFRYFIVPFTILSVILLRRNRNNTSLLLQLAFNLSINALTLYMFLYRPFDWNNKAEPVARFIW